MWTAWQAVASWRQVHSCIRDRIDGLHATHLRLHARLTSGGDRASVPVRSQLSGRAPVPAPPRLHPYERPPHHTSATVWTAPLPRVCDHAPAPAALRLRPRHAYLRLRFGDLTHGPVVTVRGDMLCGGSAWPCGFAHAVRGKSAGHQRLMDLSCAATQVQEAPLLCAMRKAGRAAPVVRSQSVSSGCVRGMPSRDRAVEACGDASCTEARGVWRRRGAGSCARRGRGCAIVRSQRMAVRSCT